MQSSKVKTMFARCLASLIVVCGVGAATADAQVDYVLMVQQTPADGGSVTPDIGVHNISANGDIKVTATPRPGYQFVYWLGDVSDPTANSTVVAVDSPKIVVAVFERSEYELPFETPTPAEGSGGGGGSGLSAGRGEQVLPFTSAPGAKNPGKGHYARYQAPPTTIPATPKPFEPTDWGNKPPTNETPEPATMMLLGIGSLLALRRKK